MSKAYTVYKLRYLDPIQKEIEDKDFFMAISYIEIAKGTIKYRFYQANMTEEEKSKISDEFKEIVSNKEFKEYLDSLMTLQTKGATAMKKVLDCTIRSYWQMPDRDKVIRALECCEKANNCGNCPYEDECKKRDFAATRDAIILLRKTVNIHK